MAFKPTPEQEMAINTKGNILVSAAAGSGKTAVLVERVVSRLCSETDAISADRLLIVTFTNAAAAEMRSRIEKRLDEIISQNPDNVSLLVQKHLLSAAKICTIDSFCIDLVRENFEKLGVSPDFKISDGATLAAIDRKVLFSIINRYLDEENSVFLELLDIIGAEYDEGNFADFVLRLYNYSCQLPFQEKWFFNLSYNYNNGFNENNSWYLYSFSTAEKVLKDIILSLENSKELLSVSEKANNSYLPCFLDAEEKLTKLYDISKHKNWDEFYDALQNLTLLSLPAIRGVGDIFEISAAKNIYKSVSAKGLESLKKLFYEKSQFINAQFSKLKAPISLLTDILIELKQRLFEEYTEINTYTFHNTEHLALSLLCEEIDGRVEIRADAVELLDRFDEVMVDEYQDTNDLQDMLFYVLSNKETKLFVVGDVKQSIYGFRGANPTNFLQKKNRYTPINNAEENDAKKIILGNNFRCKPEVCDFINFFFKEFMSAETGEIIYNEEERLIPAAVYPETDDISTELHLIATKGSELSAIQSEAEDIADYIKKTISSGKIIKEDDTTLRNARFSDFTILLRSAKLNAPIIADVLKKHGIPVSYNSEDYIETTEISTFISLLKVIDNPRSDIDLLCVMMSPIFSFTPEEMAQFRINDRKGDIYATVITAANNGNTKAENFLKTLESYRMLAITNTLPKLISLLLIKTGYLDIVSAFNDGEKRRNNLLILSGYAEQLSNNGSYSLSTFLKQIEKLSVGLRAAGTSSGGNSVRIMSIHASKGLQFPICIVAGTGSSFNDSEAHENCLFSTELGLGIKYFDENDKTKYTTIGREVILNNARAQRLEEELRLLYVAMTRTQDKLIFFGTVSDIEKKADELKSLLISSDCKITYGVFSKTKSYLEWLILCLLKHPDGKDLRLSGNSIMVDSTQSRIAVKLIDHSAIATEIEETDEENISADKQLSEQISNNISFVYPFENILEIESKASVSKLANSAESEKYSFTARPDFMNEHGLSSSQKGTAMHKVMQYFDFSKHQNIEEELQRLYEWQFLTENEYESINRSALTKFFESKIFKRILSSAMCKREMKFLTEVDAQFVAPHLDKGLGKEKIIIQGAVDVCFEEDDGIVILDFKTDRVDNISSLSDSYGEQLNIYALAAEKIFEKPVKQKIIYSFFCNDEIEI